MQKPARYLTPLEIFVRDFGRRGEKLRDRTADVLEKTGEGAKTSLKAMIDHLDAALNEAAVLQRTLGIESRRRAAGK
ncbi:MAG: hypothetical protein M0000_06385 [Actinomycetota bacterium]|nr:hypothetical protein [Actinomycetota bacterium]